MPEVVVKRFVDRFASGGGVRYSIRRRADGLFQLFRDEPDSEFNRQHQIEDYPIPGLYANEAMAQRELLSLRPNVELLVE